MAQIFGPSTTMFPKNVFLMYQFKSMYTKFSHKKCGITNINKYNICFMNKTNSFNYKNNIKI